MKLELFLDEFNNYLKGLEKIYAQLKALSLMEKDNLELINEDNGVIVFKQRYPSLKKFQNAQIVESNNKIENVPTPKPKEQEQVKINGKTIFKNKKAKTWYTRYRQNGKQYYISGKTQQEVADKLKEALNIEKRVKVNGVTLYEWYIEWKNLYKIGKVKESTLYDYEKTAKNIPNNIWNKNMKLITLTEMIEAINNITAERIRQKVYELLKAMFEKAKTHKKIKENIFEEIDKPKHTKINGKALSIKEQEAFINACNNHEAGNLFKLILFEGFRIGEALALTGNDIKEDYIIINKAINNKSQLDTTKNTQSIRKAPIFERSKELLNKYRNYGDNRIFNYAYSTAGKLMNKIAKQANIKASSKDLRHTFITNCKNIGIPEHIIQHWVGHEIGSKVTSQVYTHITEDANLFNINKLNNAKFYSNSTQK